jgi:hypothetical protein
VPRRKSDEEQDPDEFRVESVGSIVTLTEKEPPGKPYEKARFPMGFDIRPGVHKRKARKWRKVRGIT